MAKFGCGKCGKPVEVISGYLECCGVREHVSHVNKAARSASRAGLNLTRYLFDPVTTHYEDDGSCTYEGIPNTD